ncbi:sel1 repeat family protein [Helicobacter pylori]|nr:sel1 repeat family protein [Helicobacter pylori]WQS29500.1 sel1 repeat family protein [Helicobacter pylori]
MFKDFYRTTFSFLKPLLLLLCLLLPFSLHADLDDCRITCVWDEYAKEFKTNFCKFGLNNLNYGQYKQAFQFFRWAQEHGIGLGSVYLAKMYLEGKGVKMDYKKAQLYAKNAIKGYGSGLLGGALILGRMQAEGLGMKKDLKQVLNTYRQALRVFSNKGTKFYDNFRLPDLTEMTGMLIGARFIDLSSLSANPIKFEKQFAKMMEFVSDIKNEPIVPYDAAEISNNIILLKQQMGEILYKIGIAYQEGLGTKKKKEKAKKFLQKSAEFGYEKAMEDL